MVDWGELIHVFVGELAMLDELETAESGGELHEH